MYIKKYTIIHFREEMIKREVLFTKVFILHIIHLRYQNVFNVVVFESLNKNHIKTIMFLFLLTILIKIITHNSVRRRVKRNRPKQIILAN